MQKHHLATTLLLTAIFAVGSLSAQAPASTTPPAPPPDDEVVELEKFMVNGVPIDQSVLPTTRPFNSVYGFDRSIIETPRNVTIFSREQLTAISVQDVRDFSKLTASSYTRSNFGAPSNPDIRGLTADIFLNGMRIGLGSNGNGLPINFNSVESINIVKGPATAIYGTSQYVGGYADLISKRPSFGPAKGSVALTIGSFSTARLTVDYGAPISKKTAYRISYSGEDSKGYYEDGKKQTEALYYALTHRASDRYKVFFNTELFFADYTENFGINRPTQALIDRGVYQTGVNNNPAPNFGIFPFGYADATGAPISFGNINVIGGVAAPQSDPQNSRFVASGFPAVNRIALGPVVSIDRRSRLLKPGDDSEGFSINAQVVQTFNPRAGLEVENNTFFRYVDRNTLSSYSYSEIIDPSWSFENRSEFRFSPENNQINTGVVLRYQYVEAYNDFFNEPANVWDLTKDRNFINYFNSVNFPNPFTQIPVPGHPGRFYTPDNGDSGISKVTTISPFYQHSWRINNNLSFDFGARVDIMRADFHIDWVNSIIGPQRIADKITVSLPGYNASVNYKVSDNRSLYATYNLSENPVAATGTGGGVTTGGGAKFDVGSLKNEAKLVEFGFKQTFQNRSGFFGAAVFQQDRTALQQDRTTRVFRTRGVELEMNYQPSKAFFFTVGYSYLDSTVNQAEFDVGNTSLTSPLDRFFILPPGKNRRQGVPRNSFNGLASYKWDNGFGMTAGLVWNSDINNNVVGTLVIPDQYTLDLTAFYSTKSYEFRFALMNATDEKNWGAPNAVYGNESIVAELPVRGELTVKYKF